ncbi:MAG: SulP family inorganic anion transporter [Acidimicrobiales bacterium]|jgi:SulP family sulfate permease|nr:SulP family inorganic anion transporter [Acidimicrobiales bacterium]
MQDPSTDKQRTLNRITFADLLAGVSVALLLIPQSMAYAELAGLPPQIGLFASALPPIFAAFVASSPYLQTGPVALTSLLTLGALNGLADSGTAHYVELAALLALIVGISRLLFGILKMGKVVYLMNAPVVTGFTSAAAILIIASQIPKTIGNEIDANGTLNRAYKSLTDFENWEIESLLLSGITILLVISRKHIHKLFPSALFVLVGGSIYSHLTDYKGPVVGEIPTGMPNLGFDLPWSSIGDLLLSGIVIALIGFAEPASISRIFASQENQKWSANREFLSQGLANVASAFSGALPVGGSFSRSSLNKLSGAQSKWSGLITGVVVCIFLPFANILDHLPRATLGAVVIAAVIGLIQPKKLFFSIRHSLSDGFITWITFVSTLVLSPHVERGVLIGIGFSLLIGISKKSKLEENQI